MSNNLKAKTLKNTSYNRDMFLTLMPGHSSESWDYYISHILLEYVHFLLWVISLCKFKRTMWCVIFIQSLAKVTLHLFELPSTKKLQRLNRFEKCTWCRNLLAFDLGVSFDAPVTITVWATLYYQNTRESKMEKNVHTRNHWWATIFSGFLSSF